jgi:CRP-like cAMP-binding protein
MEYLVFSNAYTKIATTLISCANKFGEIQKNNSTIIDIPLTHKDIATLVGITRETTSLEMKKLEKQGFISRDGRRLIINNVKKLEEVIFLQTGGKSSLSLSL